MARTSTGGFFPRGTISGRDYPATWNFIIGNSETISIGDIVRIATSGYIRRVTNRTNQIPLGICVGIVDRNGINVFSDRATGLVGSELNTVDNQIVVSSTNQSNDQRNIKIQVHLDPAREILWFNNANDDFAQTNLFQGFGITTDFTSGSHRIDQATANDATNQSTSEMQLIKLDPDGDGDASKGLFRFVMTQIISDSTESTSFINT